MHEENAVYIAPQMLSKIELTDDEKMRIRRTQTLDRKSWLQLLAMIIFVMLIPIASILFDKYIEGHLTAKNVIQSFMFSSPLWTLLIILIVCNDLYVRFGDVKFYGAARGTVVEMSVINQVVHQKSDVELMPFQRPGMPEYREKPASYYADQKEQPFYYLTVQIEDSEKQIRYVNCRKNDFDLLRIGSQVLVVYYGNERVIGYITD